jgi:putative transcriptional regulator
VSRRTIQMYENGMGAMIDVAIRLEEFPQPADRHPGQPVPALLGAQASGEGEGARPALPMFRQEVFDQLARMGFPSSRRPAARSRPWQGRSILILTGLGKRRQAQGQGHGRGRHLQVTERCSVIFIEKSRSEHNIGGTPIVGKDELRKIAEACILL